MHWCCDEVGSQVKSPIQHINSSLMQQTIPQPSIAFTNSNFNTILNITLLPDKTLCILTITDLNRWWTQNIF